MIFKMECPQCSPGTAEYSFELTDELVYKFTCEEGHEIITLLKKNKFELLYEMGLYALVDGYTREAVTNFAAAIERFHEFCISIFCEQLGVEQNTPQGSCFTYFDYNFEQQFDLAWKDVRLSERQLGAYVMLNLVVYKKAPKLIKQKWIKFRNDVVHNGDFPKAEKANEYAEAVFIYIKDKLQELQAQLPVVTEKIYNKQIRKYRDEKIEEYNGKTILTYTPYTVFSTDDIDKLTNIDFTEAKNLAHKAYRSFKS